MKKLLYLICFLFLFAGCGSNKRPPWLIFGINQLDSYKEYCLTDRKKSGAESHFKDALNELKKSGNLDLMQKAWLTQMAMQVALLMEPDAGDYRKLADLNPIPANENYYLFLNGDIYSVNESLLPSKYGDFLKSLKINDITEIEKAIDSMKEEPVSRLIAAGIAVHRKKESEMIIQAAIDTSSQNGWKAALLKWMERQADYYESAGNASRAAKVRRHMDLIE
ncbi:hypothetical protein ACFL1N_10090 [Thermodesulfobacteriota bacterium]